LADPHPGCRNHCRTFYETRNLNPKDNVKNARDGFKKCTTCNIWIKISGRRSQPCPCCRDSLRTVIKSRSKNKELLEEVIRF
jgi:hypothetical protein